MGNARREIARGLRLIDRYAPIYTPWIDGILRNVIPVYGRRGTIYSGSDQDHPGTIYLSTGCPPVATAEMLIHEASHQYFYLAARYGAMDDGSRQTFYSPIKRTARPVSMILLAYHAFANVLLFYRMCRRAHLDDGGYCRTNEASLLGQLQEMQRALADTDALTPLGHALWRPLANRIG